MLWLITRDELSLKCVASSPAKMGPLASFACSTLCKASALTRQMYALVMSQGGVDIYHSSVTPTRHLVSVCFFQAHRKNLKASALAWSLVS